MRKYRTTKIDSLKEREELYRLMKKRLAVLIEKEKTEGLSPELRESISVCNSLLREIRLESSGVLESPHEIKNRIFGDWLRKKENEEEESED